MTQKYTKDSQSYLISRPSYFGVRQVKTAYVTYQAESNGYVTLSAPGYSANIMIGPTAGSIDVAEIHFTGSHGGSEMMAFVPKGWYYVCSTGEVRWIPINF